MIRLEPTLISVSNRTRWLHAFAAVTMMAMSVATLRPVAALADESRGLYDEKDDTSDATISRAETKRLLAEGAGVNSEFDDCTDDPDFLYKGNTCVWVGEKRTGRRCRRMKRIKQKKRNKQKKSNKKKSRSEPISYWCRQTCDYENCRTANKLQVGVYYYPWWAGDFHRGNPDNPDLYLRRQLIGPQQLPELGEYDDREPSIIAQHLEWSRNHNINLWATSWWGKDKREDKNIKDNILTHPQIHDHKIAIFYETTNRISEKYDYSLENVKPDILYLCQEYFNHKNYFRMGVDAVGHADATSTTARPVLFVYLTRKLERLNLLSDVIALMRESAREAGCGEIFIVGDQVFQAPPTDETDIISFELLDAVTNYDVYGSMRGEENLGYIGSREKVTEYYQEQNQWRALALAQNCAFIPGVSPGFNDRGVRPEVERIPLSRRLNEESPEGSLFEVALQEARTIVDPKMGNLLMVNSWNEFHEDTQIEPVISIVDDDTTDGPTSTNLPTHLTYGLEYEGYGDLYLRILKEETDSWTPSMLVPAPASFIVPSTGGAATEDRNDEDIVTISDIIGWELDQNDCIIEGTIAV